MRNFLLTIIFFAIPVLLFSQGSVSGTVTDVASGETLIGCNVYIQGTTIGTATDLDGNYVLKNVAPGTYNLIASYISYDQKIIRIDVKKGEEFKADFALQSASVTISEVMVTARKRQNTEMSMISALKSQDLIVSGISAQQIQKSQDRDAAEVLRRIPGITITDGRFVIVRGLIERYNSVLLNGATAPSSEADVRAFSFDVLPSSMIDNILIYKTPAPELPSDFAGAVVDVITKNTVDENSISFSYSLGYTPGTTFKNSLTYKGGKYDWLGFDDGTRALPSIFPKNNQMNDSLFRNDLNDSIAKISKAFRNDVFSPFYKTARPNQSLSFGINRRFVVGSVSLANMTALTYSNGFSMYNSERSEYADPNPVAGQSEYRFNYNDARFTESVRAGVMHNWLLTFNDNHKIELRNFLTQNTRNRTIMREGINYYSGDTINAYAMEFTARSTYSGQLAGTSAFNNKNTEINWLAGYSFANRLQPDFKRLYFIKQENPDGVYQYRMSVANGLPLPERGGRFYIDMYEHINNLVLNLKQNFTVANRLFTLRTGLFVEQKSREFDARNIGIVFKSGVPANMFSPIDSILRDDNFYFPGGFAYNENSPRTNHYKATSSTIAGYLGLRIPIVEKLNLYTGVRVEKFSREISEFQLDVANIPNIALDTVDVFFSSNLSYSINTENLVRFSYGRTVNRPEFREIAPFFFNDFDLNAGVWGNDTLLGCYIDNYDLRYEWYPSAGEMVSLALFHKRFKNPIEIGQIKTGSGFDYKPFNTESAVSSGIELDVRKSLDALGDKESFVRYLKNFTIVFNASLIKSEITTDIPDARERKREMAGQSPYIINGALYYNAEKERLMLSLVYNRIGRRIAFVGTIDDPHTWEMARNSLDLTLTKGLYKGLELRFGIKDIFNEPVHRLQYETVTVQSTNEVLNLEQTTFKYRPGTQYTVGLSYKF